MQRNIARLLLAVLGLAAPLALADRCAAQTLFPSGDKVGGYPASPYDSLIPHGPGGPAYGHNHYYDVVGGGHGNGCAHGFWPCSGCAGEGALMCSGIRFEYLLWWTEGRDVPPLVSTGTEILYGGEEVGRQARNGGRLTYNHLLADNCTFFDVRFWGLESSAETFVATSADNPILGVPLFDVDLGLATLFPVAFPGIAANGSIRTLSKSDLFGFDASLRRTWAASCCYQTDVFAGYNFTRLDDSLLLRANTTSIDPAHPAYSPGTQLTVQDSFRTQNEFHGVHVGFWSEKRHGYWSLEVLGKLAIGNMRQAVIIDGSTAIADPLAGQSVVDAGIFAQGSNIGEYERNLFAVVPEINVNIGYEFHPSWRFIMGYSFIYWSNVVLAGDQINPNVDFTQATGQPQFAFDGTGFWAMGLNFGLEHRW